MCSGVRPWSGKRTNLDIVRLTDYESVADGPSGPQQPLLATSIRDQPDSLRLARPPSPRYGLAHFTHLSQLKRLHALS